MKDENTTLDWFGIDKRAATADEGIDQLLPDDLKGTTNESDQWTVPNPSNLQDVSEAHTDGASEAHIYGWVDFSK